MQLNIVFHSNNGSILTVNGKFMEYVVELFGSAVAVKKILPNVFVSLAFLRKCIVKEEEGYVTVVREVGESSRKIMQLALDTLFTSKVLLR